MTSSSGDTYPIHSKRSLMKKGPFNQLTPEQQAELEALSALPDEEIDTQDIPEVLDWSGAKRGLFYRPIAEDRKGPLVKDS